MKIILPKKLYAALLAAFTLLTSHVYADGTVAGTGTAGLLFSDTGTVTVNAENFHLPSEATGGSVSTAATIIVTKWVISDGYDADRYTFGSTITGAGDIELNVWKGGTATNVYTFSGNMSGYTGSIISTPSANQTSGGLVLNFTGAGRDTISGTGDISLGATAVTFNAAGGTSTVKNGSISAKGVTFTGGTEAAPSSYTVDSAISVIDGVFTVAANTNLTMSAGSSLTLGAGVTSSLAGSVTFGSDSTLDVLNSSSFSSSSLTMAAGASINLDVAADTTALTLTGLTKSGEGMINLSVASAAGFSTGVSYTLISATDLTGWTIDDFNVSLEGSASTYGLSIVDNELIMTINRGAQALTWTGGSDTWSTDAADTPWGDSLAFANGDAVTFNNDLVDTTNTVTISGEVAPGGAVEVMGAGNTSFDSSAAGASIVGAGSLIKNGTGTLTISGSNEYAGGTTLNAGTLSIDSSDSLGTGDLNINGGTLAIADNAAITLSGEKVNLAADTIFNIDLGSSSSLTLSSASGLGTHSLSVTGSGTLSHDAWANISSLHVGEGATFVSTQTNTNSEAYKIITGTGTININNTSQWLFRMQYDSSDIFGGNINLANNGRAVLLLDGTKSDELDAAAAPRIDLNLGTGSILVLGSPDTGDSTAHETLYLSSLSGSGKFQYDWSPSSGRRSVDLQMTTDTEYGGEFIHNGRMGDFIVSSAGDSTHTLTLSGIAQIDKSGAGTQVLRVSNAVVELTAGASWNTDIVLNDSGSVLRFDNSAAATRDADAGTISGDGRVEIASTSGVTLNNANSYTGGTELNADTTLKLGADTAAGSGDIMMNASSELVLADGVTVANNLVLYADATLSAATGESATYTGDISADTKTRALAALTIDGDITLTDSLVSTDLTLAENSTLTLDNATILASITVGAAAGASVSYIDIEMTGVTATKNADRLPSFETSQGTTETDVLAFTVSGLNAQIVESATGSLTLDILMSDSDLSALTDAFAAGELIAFELDGVKGLDEDLWYNDILLNINDGAFSQNLFGVMPTGTDGNLIAYIPEPSTATLSLLALAGLLVRRRRQSA